MTSKRFYLILLIGIGAEPGVSQWPPDQVLMNQLPGAQTRMDDPQSTIDGSAECLDAYGDVLDCRAGASPLLYPTDEETATRNAGFPRGNLPNPGLQQADGSQTDRFGTVPTNRTTQRQVKEPVTQFQRYVAASIRQVLPILGASLFYPVPATFAPLDRAPVSREVLPGPGDELQLTIWGQINFFGA